MFLKWSMIPPMTGAAKLAMLAMVPNLIAASLDTSVELEAVDSARAKLRVAGDARGAAKAGLAAAAKARWSNAEGGRAGVREWCRCGHDGRNANRYEYTWENEKRG